MLTARRVRGRSSFLSQIPEVPPTVSQVDALTDFFTSVQRAYERVQEAMETAKSGHNVDVAKTTITGGGGANEWNDKAFDALKRAKADNLITADEASVLAQDVMKPLGEAIGMALDAIARSDDQILTAWDMVQGLIAKTITGSTGWVTEKWHNLAKAYKLMDVYLADANQFLTSIQGDAQSDEAKAYLNDYKKALGTMTAQKTYVETTLQSAGIPVATFQEAASKEDISSLGADPATGILGTVIVGTVTVGVVLKVIGAIIGVIGPLYLFGALDAALSLVGLDSLVIGRLKRTMQLEEQAKTELEKEKSTQQAVDLQKKSAAIKTQIATTQKTADGMAAVAGLQAKADEMRKKVVQKQTELGVDVPVTDQPWFPWALAIGGGISLAVIIYWYMHRKAE